jgi:UDP-glucose 4-epimerase
MLITLIVAFIQLIESLESIIHVKIQYSTKSRHEGDLAAYRADATKAKKLLGWQTELTLNDMVRDSWAWQSSNPKGYN